MKKKFTFILLLFFSLFFLSDTVRAKYWLIIGTYRQGPAGRPEVSGITSPSLHSIPMRNFDTWSNAVKKINNEIYKSV